MRLLKIMHIRGDSNFDGEHNLLGSRNSSYPEPFHSPPYVSLVAQFSYNPRSDLYSLTSLQNQKRICLAKTQELATYCFVSVKEIDMIENQIQMEYAMMIF